MNINIEQVAIAVGDIEERLRYYEAMGHEFVRDEVVAHGEVYGQKMVGGNIAYLAFNYTIIPGKELELIEYMDGDNWLAHSGRAHRPSMSHMGMHVESIADWVEENDPPWGIAQEVRTVSHTNPAVVEAGRRYHYLIWDSRDDLGFDLKLIERLSV